MMVGHIWNMLLFKWQNFAPQKQGILACAKVSELGPMCLYFSWCSNTVYEALSKPLLVHTAVINFYIASAIGLMWMEGNGYASLIFD